MRLIFLGPLVICQSCAQPLLSLFALERAGHKTSFFVSKIFTLLLFLVTCKEKLCYIYYYCDNICSPFFNSSWSKKRSVYKSITKLSLSLHNIHTLKFVIVNKSLNLTVMQINIRVAIDTLEHTLNFKLNLDVTWHLWS